MPDICKPLPAENKPNTDDENKLRQTSVNLWSQAET